MGLLDSLDLLDPTDLLETEALLAFLVQLDLLGLEVPKDHRANEETLASKERKDLKDHLDCKGLQDLWVHEESVVKRAALVSLDPLGWVGDQETKVHLDLLAAWDHLVLQDYLDPQARPDPLALQVNEASVVLWDHLVLLAHLV